MNILRLTKWCATVAFLSLIATFALNQYCAAQQASVAAQDGVEVLTRGPVHEAFAETITFDPEPGIVAPKAPPADIEEVPPQQRPAGRNVTWIPGYWAWDDERNDFLWLSGIWRALPPGRQWVPGYWGQSRTWLSMDFGLLGRCSGSRDSILARAAGNGRGWSQHCRDFRGRNLVAGLLGLAAKPLCMAPRILDARASRLGLGARPLRVDTQRLRLRRWLLRLLGSASRCCVCAGLF